MKESAKENQEQDPVAVVKSTEDASNSDPTKKYQQALNQAFAQMDIQQKNTRAPETDNTTANDECLHDYQKRQMLKMWLNRLFRIKMTDGRILNGYFVCTDAEANVVLQSTSEYTELEGEERILGLVMIPGRYIVSIEERNSRFAW